MENTLALLCLASLVVVLIFPIILLYAATVSLLIFDVDIFEHKDKK